MLPEKYKKRRGHKNKPKIKQNKKKVEEEKGKDEGSDGEPVLKGGRGEEKQSPFRNEAELLRSPKRLLHAGAP